MNVFKSMLLEKISLLLLALLSEIKLCNILILLLISQALTIVFTTSQPLGKSLFFSSKSKCYIDLNE